VNFYVTSHESKSDELDGSTIQDIFRGGKQECQLSV
jgi:hypothetical protein